MLKLEGKSIIEIDMHLLSNLLQLLHLNIINVM